MKHIIAFFLVFAAMLIAGNAMAQTTNSVKWNTTKHDFGKLPQNIPAPITFEFTNTGKAPVILSSVQGSCGCTATDYTKEPVKAGAKGKVSATYNAAALGNFTKTVTVKTNTGETHVLTITGVVEAKDAKSAN